MSGGRFRYQEHAIRDIEIELLDSITRGEVNDVKVRRAFRKAAKMLRKVYVYVRRADYYLSGDDGAETFVTRLAEDLKEVK